MKISHKDLKTINRLSKREMTVYIESIYKSGFNDGYEACQMQKGDAIDFELLKIAIKATEGIGDVLYGRLVDTIDKLCFRKDDENDGISC